MFHPRRYGRACFSEPSPSGNRVVHLGRVEGDLTEANQALAENLIVWRLTIPSRPIVRQDDSEGADSSKQDVAFNEDNGIAKPARAPPTGAKDRPSWYIRSASALTGRPTGATQRPRNDRDHHPQTSAGSPTGASRAVCSATSTSAATTTTLSSPSPCCGGSTRCWNPPSRPSRTRRRPSTESASWTKTLRSDKLPHGNSTTPRSSPCLIGGPAPAGSISRPTSSIATGAGPPAGHLDNFDRLVRDGDPVTTLSCTYPEYRFRTFGTSKL